MLGGVGAEWPVKIHEPWRVHTGHQTALLLWLVAKQGFCWCRCEVSGGVGAEWPVEVQEQWRFHDGSQTLQLLGLMALHPDVHLAKHTERQPDDARRQHGIWMLQGMNQ